MATELMPATDAVKSTTRPADPTPQEIIREARAKQAAPAERGTRRAAWGCALATALMLWLAFPPFNWTPFGWVALVPLLVMARARHLPRHAWFATYAAGALFWLCSLHWMRLGDISMYLAWGALSLYLAFYWVLFVALSRAAMLRLRMPLVAAAPVVWVGLEYLRAHLLTGFAWYNLSHTQYQWVDLIQVSDIVGAYGVSFVMAMAAAAVAILIPPSWYRQLRLVPAMAANDAVIPSRRPVWQVGAMLLLFAAVLAYGVTRRQQAEFVAGPRMALVQGNFPISLRYEEGEAQRTHRTHVRLTGMAVRHQPDVIVWPESMLRWPLFEVPEGMSDADLTTSMPSIPVDRWRETSVRKMLKHESERAGAALIIGLNTIVASEDGPKIYNSAALVEPGVGVSGRYDKLHRVPFGEYVPLADVLPFLSVFSPSPANAGLAAGEGPVFFEHRDWVLTPIICFEDTVPHLVRGIVKTGIDRGTPPDVLVNQTNDGWFQPKHEFDKTLGTTEPAQHLITAAFRSVETRTPMVRAVNTGVSAVIDGNGQIVEPDVFLDAESGKEIPLKDPETGLWKMALDAVVVHTVPLDSRSSLYVRYGDWFAAVCASLAALAFVASCAGRIRNRRQTAEASPATV